MSATTPRALVVGLGVAGMSTAIALRKAGWEPVVVERAASRRRGGYFIGLYGTGLAAAEHLGVKDAIHTRTPATTAAWEIDRHGNRYRGVGFLEQPGEPAAVLRGDIEDGLFSSLGDIEIRYSTVPVAIDDLPSGAEVTLRGETAERTERFDLVIGADGMRSTVRQLKFAPHSTALRSMKRVICAFQLDRQVDGFPNDEGVVLAEPGRSLWIFPLSDRPPTALLSYRVSDIDRQFVDPAPVTVRRAYCPPAPGPVMGQVLDQFDAATEYLFDSVHQVKLKSWRRGRVLLLGDAAWCVTLYSGMGASSGMAGAALLGDLLARHPADVDAALTEWEQRVRPFVGYHQQRAHFNSQFFTPSGRLMHVVRTRMMRQGGQRIVENSPQDSAFSRRMAAMRNLDLVTATPA
jgi:2-polyprenyl-6-methoxyphenol hydroxylase-like FAD-dependent oxidoreductase